MPSLRDKKNATRGLQFYVWQRFFFLNIEMRSLSWVARSCAVAISSVLFFFMLQLYKVAFCLSFEGLWVTEQHHIYHCKLLWFNRLGGVTSFHHFWVSNCTLGGRPREGATANAEPSKNITRNADKKTCWVSHCTLGGHPREGATTSTKPSKNITRNAYRVIFLGIPLYLRRPPL